MLQVAVGQPADGGHQLVPHPAPGDGGKGQRRGGEAQRRRRHQAQAGGRAAAREAGAREAGGELQKLELLESRPLKNGTVILRYATGN